MISRSERCASEELFGEVFATGLEVVDTSDDERNCIIIVVENYSHGAQTWVMSADL